MAYVDESGRITIDEQAAARDIKRLRESAQVLKDSRAAIRSLKSKAGELEGQMSAAILEKAQAMEKRLTQMIDKLEETASYIQKTVNKYEQLDREIKRAIQAAADAAEAAARAAAVQAKSAGSISSVGGAAASSIAKSATQAAATKTQTKSSSSGSSKKKEDLGDKIKDAAEDFVDFLGGWFN